MNNNFGGGNPPPQGFMGFNSGNAGSAFSTQTAAAPGSFGSGNFGSAFGQQQPARGGARGKPQQHQGAGMS
jgi:hypothetical protein